MISRLVGKFDTYGHTNITIIKRMSESDYKDYWFCAYVKCAESITVDPEYPTQGYTEYGDVMLLDQPAFGLNGWYYFWDTAHAGMTNTIENLLCMVVSDLSDR